ncbi:hypothetical protein N7U49_21215 [Streptomyces sp. AD2-2]|nr:hypothetical protein N7U49_21215 [Streptomyces sp. AD2-2]
MLDLGRHLGGEEQRRMAEERPGEVAGHLGHAHSIRRSVGDHEEDFLHDAILGGHTLNAFLLPGETLPHFQVSLGSLVLVMPDGSVVPVVDDQEARLVDLLNIRAEAHVEAGELGLLEGDKDSVVVEEWVFEKMAGFVKNGWIKAWSDQPDNGEGAIVWWMADDPGITVPVSPEGELVPVADLPAGVHGRVIGYDEIHTAVQYFEDGRKTAQGSAEES